MSQKQLAHITVSEDFAFFSHRGFGEKVYARYADTKRLRFVHNQLSGLELGIEKGADILELDLSKTRDGKIVTEHGFPLQKYLSETEQEYLEKYPEALTLQELLDWISHQHESIQLYLELKSPITIKEILLEIQSFANNNEALMKRLYDQLLFYSHSLQVIKQLIAEKQKLGLSSKQFRIFWLVAKFISVIDIKQIAKIGSKDCRVYGIEQGTFPWGSKPLVNLLHVPLPPFMQIKKHLHNLKTVVDYAHQANLNFIVGTVDNTRLMRILVEQGVNGIVPNDPSFFSQAGITKKDNPKHILIPYIPSTMKTRLHSI